jgi:cytochrome P450
MTTVPEGIHDERIHALFRDAREQGPVALGEDTGALYVLHHEEVQALLHHPSVQGVGLSVFDQIGVPDGPLRTWYGQLMFTNEGERHARMRRLVSKAFTPRSVEALREGISKLVDEALSQVLRDGGGDLVSALGDIPIRGICRLLGVPDDQALSYRDWADAVSPAFGFMDEAQIEAAQSAISEMLEQMEALIAERRAAPRDDLVTRLIEAESDGQRLGRDELPAMIGNLIAGGHDTTASQIGCSVSALLAAPREWARLREAPELCKSAVTETMRFEPSIFAIPRTAIEPVVVGGEEREPGTLILLSVGSANRDPAVWSDPDRLEIDRFAAADAGRVASFGAGTHYCLGASLARMTLEEVIGGLSRRDLEPAEEIADLPWRQVLGRSPERLPVRVVAG